MATIRKQGRERYEIRECRRTPRGPRQVVLARFDRVLTPELLDRAQARARGGFDRARIVARARRLGAGVAEPRQAHARALLSSLRRGEPLDRHLVCLLREALAPLPAGDVPEHLADASEWIGESAEARGQALRGLLRTADRILRGRPSQPRARERTPYPRFRSVAPGEAA